MGASVPVDAVGANSAERPTDRETTPHPRVNVRPYLADLPLLLVGVGLGAVVRWIVAGFGGQLSSDAAAFYLPNARALVEGGLGNWADMTIAVPPLFPTVVALLEPITGDVEFAALTVSILSGAAMVFPLYGFARWMFPGRVTLHRFALLIAVVHPFSVRYGGDAKGDAFYALLFNLALWVGLVLMRRPSAGRGALFGLFLGLAYLVRPEALGLAVLLAVACCVIGWQLRGQPSSWRKYAQRVGVAGVVAVLFLLPSLAWNALFVHEKIGVWTLSPKAGVLQDFDKGLGDSLGELNEARTMTRHEESLSQKGKFESFSPWQQFQESPGPMLRSYVSNLGEYLRVFPPAVGILMCFMLVVGMVTRFRQARRGAFASILILYSFYGLSFMMFYVSRRFWLALVPVLLPYCAAGVWATAMFLRRRWRVAPGWMAVLVVICLLPEGASRSLRSANGWFTSPERQLGERVLAEFGPNEKFVSARGRTTFYAQGDNLSFPSNPLADIAQYMENRGARFLVIDTRRARPDLLQELPEHPDYREYGRVKGRKSTIIVYEFTR